jgi:hypothetical protein
MRIICNSIIDGMMNVCLNKCHRGEPIPPDPNGYDTEALIKVSAPLGPKFRNWAGPIYAVA